MPAQCSEDGFAPHDARDGPAKISFEHWLPGHQGDTPTIVDYRKPSARQIDPGFVDTINILAALDFDVRQIAFARDSPASLCQVKAAQFSGHPPGWITLWIVPHMQVHTAASAIAGCDACDGARSTSLGAIAWQPP